MMRTSSNGRKFIGGWEGLRLRSYKDIVGKGNVFAVKGHSQRGRPIIGRPSIVDVNLKGETIKRGTSVYLIGTDTAKNLIYDMLRLPQPGPGYVHFSKDLPDEYYEQLTSEKRITKHQKGQVYHVWTLPSGVRNEALDLEVYAIAAAQKGALHGRVLDGKGAPAAGALVYVSAGLEAYVFPPGDAALERIEVGEEDRVAVEERLAELPAVALPGRVEAVTIGVNHACAGLVGGGVMCWGNNSDGQLGYGDEVARTAGPTLPLVDLGAGLAARALVTGYAHNCALFTSDATLVKCWGLGGDGELGLDDITDRGDAPGEMGAALARVGLGAGFQVASLSAGMLHTCALSTDQRLKCWGHNRSGQLGYGHTDSPGRKPGQSRAVAPMGDALPFVDLGVDVRVVVPPRA